MTEISNDVRTAGEKQSSQARRMSAEERKTADQNAAAHKRRVAEEQHAARLAGATLLYVGQREVKKPTPTILTTRQPRHSRSSCSLRPALNESFAMAISIARLRAWYKSQWQHGRMYPRATVKNYN
jgi:hypothetical protein